MRYRSSNYRLIIKFQLIFCKHVKFHANSTSISYSVAVLKFESFATAQFEQMGFYHLINYFHILSIVYTLNGTK